ncbi:phage minor head protein [Zhengella sp. ZM62]|uniref:phage minor head protein n=1 Tax=Zhengella sedimenti TaxID=3390035 RepID=UPI003976097C
MADLLDRFEPAIRDAFLEAVREVTSKARVADIAKALERGDVQGALDALYMDRSAFETFERAIEEAYGEGGKAVIDDLGRLRDADGNGFVVRFDVRNLRAEQWLKEHSSRLVTRIIQEQRLNIRNALEEGMREGNNPRTVALDIVGRIDRQTGRRTGGIVGLSWPQERAVANARRELESGDFAAYRQRERRDRRFDRTIAKAEREGRGLTAKEISTIISRYSDRLLKLRGDTIGRTEALASLHAAQHEALQQLVDTGKVQASQIRRVWDATGDARTRLDHLAADSQSVGLNETFTVGGRQMKYPGDPAGGPEQVINCRCVVRVRIDFLANVG